MARLMFLTLCALVLTACSPAFAQGPLEATQTVIAQQADSLEKTRTALDIAVVQTQQQQRIATSTAAAQTAVVNNKATLQSQLATATSARQTHDVTMLRATQTAIANQQATIQARQTNPAPPITGQLYPTLATPLSQNPIYVFVRGQDGLLYYKVYQNGDWADWKALQPPPVGVTNDSPSAVVLDDGRVHLFVRGQDGAAWHISFDGDHWSLWESLGGKLTSGPSAVVVR